MLVKTEMEMLIDVIVKREKSKGLSDTDARIFALGYLGSYVQHNLINQVPKARRKLLKADINERITIIAGDI
jgi:hypothetical protein